MDRSKILTGAYFFDKPLWTKEQVSELKKSGMDFIVSVSADRELSELFKEAGIKSIVNSRIKMWWGDDGQKAGQYADTYPISELDELNIEHQPAIWGDYVIDEPHTKDLEHIGLVLKQYEKLFPGLLPYINLYPNYANFNQLGCSYKEHIEEYVKKVNNDYICLDFYPYTGKKAVNMGILDNFDIIAEACRKSGRDMWAILQAGAWKAEDILSEFQIRWQCYTSLAYGSTVIMHACYSRGWWEDSTCMVNKEGEKNPTYDYVKRINEDLRALSDIYMQYKNIAVLTIGEAEADNVNKALELQAKSTETQGFNGNEFFNSVNSDGALLIGCFEHKSGNGNAMMLVNMKNPLDENAAVTATLCFKNKATLYMGGKKTTIKKENEQFTFSIPSGEGIFIVE